jgi:hypothetical protein
MTRLPVGFWLNSVIVEDFGSKKNWLPHMASGPLTIRLSETESSSACSWEWTSREAR